MKVIYFDTVAGISGDMTLGALIDAGLPLEYLRKELKKTDLEGYSLETEKVLRNGISAVRCHVKCDEEKHHRNFSDIRNIIEKSTLSEKVKDMTLSIFRVIAEAEGRIHNMPANEVHFHEVGALDSIIDIVGAAIGLEYFGVEKVFSSPVHLGRGMTHSMHGKIPVPAPATVEILKNAPVYSTGIEKELTTPTGAAILKTLSESFGPMPLMSVSATGYGGGSRELDIPNVLRVMIGDLIEKEYSSDSVLVMETNIDDMNPEFFEHTMDLLFEGGALDVFIQPIVMKKSRPASLLTVIAEAENKDELAEIIFRETTTSGIRYSETSRIKLDRELVVVKVDGEDVAVKVIRKGNSVYTVAPEYEDCRRVASKTGLPLKEIYNRAREAYGLLQEK